MRSIVAFALLLGSAFTLGVNEAYKPVLNGQAEFTVELLEQMYEKFNAEYNPLTRPSSHYSKRVSAVDRKALFAAKIKDIIDHNTDPSKNWKKGLNEYSDMTDAEFNDYFHLVG